MEDEKELWLNKDEIQHLLEGKLKWEHVSERVQTPIVKDRQIDLSKIYGEDFSSEAFISEGSKPEQENEADPVFQGEAKTAFNPALAESEEFFAGSDEMLDEMSDEMSDEMNPEPMALRLTGGLAGAVFPEVVPEPEDTQFGQASPEVISEGEGAGFAPAGPEDMDEAARPFTPESIEFIFEDVQAGQANSEDISEAAQLEQASPEAIFDTVQLAPTSLKNISEAVQLVEERDILTGKKMGLLDDEVLEGVPEFSYNPFLEDDYPETVKPFWSGIKLIILLVGVAAATFGIWYFYLSQI